MKKEVGILLILVFLFSSVALGLDSDRDGIPDEKDKYKYDFDNDGLSDEYEKENGLNPQLSNSQLDTDNDGLLDLQEATLGTNPTNPDSDGDGYNDKKENELGTNPNNKYSPINFQTSINILIPVLSVLLAVLLFVYFLVSRKKDKEIMQETKKKQEIMQNQEQEKEELMQEEIKTPQKKVGFKINLKGVDLNKINQFLEKTYQNTISIFEKAYFSLLGPNSKFKKKTQEKIEEEQKVAQEQKVKEEEKSSKKNIPFYAKETRGSPESLLRKLGQQKRENEVKDFFDYFDKEVKGEELSVLQERKTRKEVLDYLHKRRELKNQLRKNLEEQRSGVAQKKQIFEKLDKISDDEVEDVFEQIKKIKK
ncbi:hypothetical protein GOV05_05080 [Candidatus Woesearchaeota archaeon]|nr:hypothetical protein [Candidatus Woesearchaeota archaeon]